MARWMALGVVMAVLASGGCAYVELQQPKTGQTTSCGTIPIRQWYGYERATGLVYEEINCIDRHGGLGYERVAPRWTWL